MTCFKLRAVLFHFHNRRFCLWSHPKKVNVLLDVCLTDGGRKENHQHEKTEDAFVSLDWDVNQYIKGLERRVFWFLQIQNQGEVRHHEHREDVNDHNPR